MRIVVIADDDVKALEGLPEEADLLISLGDLWDKTILEAAKRLGTSKIFALKGNHDSAADFPEPIINLHRRAVRFDKWTFGGYGGSWKYKPKGHHLFDQEEVELDLEGFPNVDVFLAHNSPSGIHERDGETHQGFRAFNTLIEISRPYLFLHGHQHKQQNSHLAHTEVIGIFGNATIELK